jgi:glycosyltransferase involved in cell wall biosynthesis
MLTVLFATRNRADILRDVLEEYCHLQPPSSGWKLVVVDNGSTDHTAEVIASFVDRLPLHFMVEPRLGKNFALNTGLELVEGDLTALTDDDAFPHTDWLLQLRKAADDHPAYSMFGGTIVARWEVPPPSWIQWLDVGPIFTITPPSMKEGELTFVALVQGPNMAIRASVFQSGIRFDTCIGPRGSSYPMGSETEMLLRLSRQGHKAWHVQGAVVEHFVRKEQLNKTWILQRAIRYGRGWYRMAPASKLWVGVPRHLFVNIAKEGLFMCAACVLFKRRALLRSRWRFNYLRGQVIEARILARERSARGQSACTQVLH